MRVQISKWGNSTAVRLPQPVVKALGLKPGDEAELTVEGKEVRLKRVPVRTSKITYAEMIAEMDRLGPDFEPPMIDWGDDVGDEIIQD